MTYQVGGEILSREKHRGRTMTIHGLGGEKTVIGLKYTGQRRERFGMMHVYEVIAVNKTSKPKGRNAHGR